MLDARASAHAVPDEAELLITARFSDNRLFDEGAVLDNPGVVEGA